MESDVWSVSERASWQNATSDTVYEGLKNENEKNTE